MNSAPLDWVQAWSAIADSSGLIAAMVPVYAAIWTLAWLSSEQRQAKPPASPR